MKCVAIDDEKNALEVVALYCAKIPEIELVATFTDPIEASAFLRKENIDLLFVDINMQGLNGFEVVENLTDKTKVIFTTAYSEYAVDSYRVDALDYLMKPISFSRFLKAVNKALAIVPTTPVTNPTENETGIITVKSGSTLHRIKKSDILFLQAEGNYTKYVTASEKILELATLKDSLSRLGEGFLQIHRSYAIALHLVDKVEQHQVVVQGHSLPISGSYRKSLLKHFWE